MPRGRPRNPMGKLQKGQSRTGEASKRKIKAIVRKEFDKQTDCKFASQTSSNIAFNSAITSSGEMYTMWPDVSQGDGDYQRTADKIAPQYLKIEGMLKITNTSTAPEPKEAIIYFLEDLRQRDSNAATISTPNFLNNNGLTQNMDGTFATMSLPIDTQRFRLIKKIRVKLTQNYMPASLQTGVVDQSAVLYRHFKFKINFANKSRKTTLVYPDNTYVQPVNHNYLWSCGYVNYSGAVDVALVNVQLQITRMLWYKDLQ